MNPKYKKYIKKYYKYVILKGEIQAHNNSHILKNELKKIVHQLKGMKV